MLKESEIEETIVILVTFLSLAAIQLRGAPWLRLCPIVCLFPPHHTSCLPAVVEIFPFNPSCFTCFQNINFHSFDFRLHIFNFFVTIQRLYITYNNSKLKIFLTNYQSNSAFTPARRRSEMVPVSIVNVVVS